MGRNEVTKCIESGLPPVAGIILIVAAGGGFKQVLVDTGIGTLLARWAEGANISVHRAGLGDRGADPAGHGFGDRRHHHRVVADRSARRGHAHR